MSRYDHSKEKQNRKSVSSIVKIDEGTAARTRPYSLEEIMLRRTNKAFPENLKESFNTGQKKLLKSTVEIVSGHFSPEKACVESANGHSASLGHLSSNTSKRSSRRKDESASMKEDCIDDNARKNHLAKAKPRSRTMDDRESKPNRNEAEEKIYEKWKHDKISDNDFKRGLDSKNVKYLQIKGKHADRGRDNFERERKNTQDVEGNSNSKEGFVDTRHEKHRNDTRKHNRDVSNNFVKEADKKHSRHSAGKDRYSDRSRGKAERESDRNNENFNDKRSNVSATRKNNFHNQNESKLLERKERDERMKTNYEESRVKRGRSRSRERDERRKRSPSGSPKVKSYHDEEPKESLSQSLKDRSRKQQSNSDRDKSPTNGSSSHQRKLDESLSKLGGYSPRKRKPEASAQTLSPSRHSQKRKTAGWDLPPQGTESGLSAFVVSNLLPSPAPTSNPQQLTSATIDSALLKSLPVAFVSGSLKGINASADSVQLTQATRPMRRLHLENLPTSASEKAVLDCLNGLLLSTGINHVQGAQPCIGCTIHKEKGQALVEFLTPEDASSALSFDGSTILGSIVKIRRPKDYVEVANGESERSTEAAIAVSDVVQDSPDKVFIGGISKDLSPEMLLEVASAFGSLKAFHFEASSADGPCAFMEYLDHSVTAKACAGLNGMKLAGKVLTVVQAMPNTSSSENDGRQPHYNVPELAKPLLKEPTQVLKLSNVFDTEALSSVTEEEREEVMEDIRLECSRFGTVKSINVVKHVDQMNNATDLEKHEVVNDTGMTGASLTYSCGEKSAKSCFIEPKSYLESRDTSKHVVSDAGEEPKDLDFVHYNTIGGTELSAQINGEASCDACHPKDQMAVEDTVNGKTDGAPLDAYRPEDQMAIEDIVNEKTREKAQCEADHSKDHFAVEKTVSENKVDKAPCDADHPEDLISVEENENENSQDEAPSDADNPEDDMAVDETVNEKAKDGNLQKSLDDKLGMTDKDGSDVIGADHGKAIEALNESNLISGDSDLQHCSTDNGSRESVSVEKETNADQEANHENVFQLGSVFVEYKRTEACCMAAHCLHGRSFDNRTVMVEYVPLHVYRARFTK